MRTHTNTEMRAAIVSAAMSWVGTPFHDHAGVKGAGVDCMHLLRGVFSEVGLIELFDVRHYYPEWYQHRDKEIFLEGLSHYAWPVYDEAMSGDVLMFNYGRHAAHAAIMVDEHTIVHAFKPAGAVVVEDPAPMMSRFHSCWSLF